jgi:hypothetical protein
LVQARHEVARGVHTAESESITVREAAGMWTEKGRLDGLERSTLRQRGNHVELHIAPLIGEVKLPRLSTPAIEAFRDEMLKKGLSRYGAQGADQLERHTRRGTTPWLGGSQCGAAG